MSKGVRTSAKAVIIRQNKLLVLRKQGNEGPYCVLPGGGQHKDEPLHAALQRECEEEIGTGVRVGALLFVRDYIADNHEFAFKEEHAHQVDFMFACSVPDDYTPHCGSEPDSDQEDVAWVALEQLGATNFYPKALYPLLFQLDAPGRPVYLGDVN